MNAIARLIEGLITFHKSILLAALECFQLEPFRQYCRTQKNQNYHNQNDNFFVDFSLVVVVLDFNVLVSQVTTVVGDDVSGSSIEVKVALTSAYLQRAAIIDMSANFNPGIMRSIR